jgi:hypothetical protein
VAGLPVGSASVNGADITVSYLLKNPRIIEQRLGELVNLNYWADQILPNIGPPGGGVVIYQEWVPTYAMLDRQAEELAPDAEVPLASTEEGEVKIAQAKLSGLGYSVTDTQRIRNQMFVVNRKERGLANSITDRFNKRAVTAIKDAISANSRTFAVTDWSTIDTNPASPTRTPRPEWPDQELEQIRATMRVDRLPFDYDGLLIQPQDLVTLKGIFEVTSNQALGEKLSLRTIIEDNTGDIDRHVVGGAADDRGRAGAAPQARRRPGDRVGGVLRRQPGGAAAAHRGRRQRPRLLAAAAVSGDGVLVRITGAGACLTPLSGARRRIYFGHGKTVLVGEDVAARLIDRKVAVLASDWREPAPRVGWTQEATIPQILDWVGDIPERARLVIASEECREPPRSTLLEQLRAIAG